MNLLGVLFAWVVLVRLFTVTGDDRDGAAGRREDTNRRLILNSFKDDLGVAQKVVFEEDAPDSVVPKRLLEKYPVGDF